MQMNWFMVSIALLQFCAAISYWTSKNYLMALLIGLYGVSNIILLIMGGYPKI
jgi:hypothetical protein